MAPHPSDPPHTPYDHAWISFNPQQFSGNEVECKITIDTSKLLAGKSYTREVVLHSNSSSDIDGFSINLHTAPLPNHQKTSYLLLLLILIASGLAGYFLGKYPLLLFLPVFLPVLVALYITNMPELNYFNIEFKKAFISAFIVHLILIYFFYNRQIPRTKTFFIVLLLADSLGAWLGMKIIKISDNLIRLFILLLITKFIVFIGYLLYFLSYPLGSLVLIIIFIFTLIKLSKKVIFKLQKVINLNIINNCMVNFIVTFGLSIGAGIITRLEIIKKFLFLNNNQILWIASIGLAPVIFSSIGLGYYLIKQIKNIRKVANYRRSETSLITP